MHDASSRSTRRFVQLSLLVVAGGALAHYWMSPVFRVCPNSMKRAQVILNSIHSPDEEKPEICIFGNSTVMSGIDAKVVSRNLPGEPLAWNLSSSGQAALESFLYYQELPESTKVVVQCICAYDFEGLQKIEEQKYNAIFLYGLRPDQYTLDLVDRYAHSTAGRFLHESEIVQQFAGRWALRSAVDTSVRSLIRKDLDLSNKMNDLYFPASGARKIPPDKLEALLKRSLSQRHGTGFHCSEKSKEFLLGMKESCESRGIRYVLVILPYHPRYLRHLGPEFIREFAAFVDELRAEHNFEIVNCLELLDEKAFCDHCHLVQSGAEILTDKVSTELKKIGICSSINRHSSRFR